ncbi:MAG: family 16 glycoside hydrolase [Armatimonadota bacterium]
MNPDPAYPWGKAIQKQLDNIISTYPDVDGIFLDRDDYRDYDFSHSDGLTMQGSRPCYMLAFAQEKALQLLRPKLHKRDKGIWANGPTNLEVCSGIDGIMTEAVGALANQTQFFGVDRPMICLPYDATVAATEIKLKGCMTGGYFPAVSETSVGSPSRALEAKYVPLFKLMKGRKWVLNAHAIQAPDGISPNLFKATNGDYLAAVISDKGTLIVPDGSCPVISHNIEVSISVSDPQAIRYCYQLSPDFQGVTELPITRTGKTLKVTIPILISGSMLVFSSERRYDTTRQSIPLLVRGTSNTLRLKSAIKGAVSVQTPWGTFNSKAASADATTIPIDVPASASGEVLLNLIAHGKTSVLSAWIVNPVELALPQEPPFIRDVKGSDIPIEVTNYTNQLQPITVSGTFSEGKGSIGPQRTKLVLKPMETKVIPYHVDPSTRQAVITWNLENNQQSRSYVMPLGSFTKFQSSDMFHDDFSSNDMSRWAKTDGVWTVKDGTAQGRGPIHAGYIGDAHWSDYEVETSTCMQGSELPEITWVKSYIHVRMTSQDNYYRFGVHGDAGILELSKIVNGEWAQLVVRPFDIPMGKWITLRVAVKGSDIKCYADGKLVCQATDTSLPKGGIAIGVFDNQMINLYKHVVVRRAD